MEIEVGGQIQGISLGSFLQIVHMDKTSCTLKIYSNDDVGYLFLTEGTLIAAEAGEINGVEAAYEILSWNKTVIIIDNAPAPEKTIQMPLMSILMEGLRRKDEKNAQAEIVKDARKELDVEFDPDSYVSKDDEISSQFVVSDKNAGGDIELDYGDSPPPVTEKKETEPTEKKETEPALEKKEVVPENKSPDSEEEDDDENYEDEVEFEGEDTLLPEKTARGIFKKLILTTLILSCATFAGLQYYKISLLKKDYHAVILKIQNQKKTDLMKKNLSDFINTRDDDDRYLLKAVNVMNELENLIRVDKKVAALKVDDHYKKTAMDLYADFLRKNKNTAFSKYVAMKKKRIPVVLEARDFKKLGVISGLGRTLRMKRYKAFLEKYPSSKHSQAVKNMVAAVGDEVFLELKREIVKCNQADNWEKCIQLSDKFINDFHDDNRLENIQKTRQKMQEKSDYADLKFRAGAVDFSTARDLFMNYLKKNPDSSLKKEVRLEISRLNRKIDFKSKWDETYKFCTNTVLPLSQRLKEINDYIERDYSGLFREDSARLLNQLKLEEKKARAGQYKLDRLKREKARLAKIQAEKDRIAKEKEETRLKALKLAQHEKRLKEESERMTLLLKKSGSRFKVNSDRTAIDTRTGKIWSIIDSGIETGKCMDFVTAKNYVSNLRTGGYKDWRLPDTGELAVIYNSRPYFPLSGAEWYWTSEIIDEAMIDGGKSAIFYPDKKDVFKKVYIKYSNCGYVHAVRP